MDCLDIRIQNDCYRYLDLDDESKILADSYIQEKILNKSSLDDAYHIAIATVNRLDVLEVGILNILSIMTKLNFLTL